MEDSLEQMRRSAAAANLRLAFGAPVGGDLPVDFAALLDRMREVTMPSVPPRGVAAGALR